MEKKENKIEKVLMLKKNFKRKYAKKSYKVTIRKVVVDYIIILFKKFLNYKKNKN